MSGGKGDRRIANANVQGSHRAIASDELATAGRLRRGAVEHYAQEVVAKMLFSPAMNRDQKTDVWIAQAVVFEPPA